MEWMQWSEDEPGDDDDFKAVQSHYFETPLDTGATFTFSNDTQKDKLVQLKSAKSPAKKKSAQAAKREAARKWQARHNAKNLTESQSATAAIRNAAGRRRTSVKNVTESQSATAAIRNAAGRRRTSVKKKKKTKKVLQRRTSDLERKVSAKVREVERAVERTEEAKVLGSKAAKRREDIPGPDDSAEVVDTDELELPQWVRHLPQYLLTTNNTPTMYNNRSNKNVSFSAIPRSPWLHES